MVNKRGKKKKKKTFSPHFRTQRRPSTVFLLIYLFLFFWTIPYFSSFFKTPISSARSSQAIALFARRSCPTRSQPPPPYAAISAFDGLAAAPSLPPSYTLSPLRAIRVSCFCLPVTLTVGEIALPLSLRITSRFWLFIYLIYFVVLLCSPTKKKSKRHFLFRFVWSKSWNWKDKKLKYYLWEGN